MGKEKKGINPADAFRREQKKKDQKKAKQSRDELREVRSLLNDPSKIDQEIDRVQKLSDENKIDKGLKDRIIELKRMREVALTKQQMDAALGRKKLQSDAAPSAPVSKQMTPHYAQQAPPPPPSAYAQYSHAYAATAHAGQAPYYQQFGFPPQVAPYGAFPGHAPQVLMGGMNGIPLPPPRPPMGGTDFRPPPPPPPAQSHSGPNTAQSARPNRKRERQQEEYVDPLDPAAAGYVDQFGRKPGGQQRRKDMPSVPEPEADPDVERRLAALTAAYVPPTSSAVSSTAPSCQLHRQTAHEPENDIISGPSLPPGYEFPLLTGYEYPSLEENTSAKKRADKKAKKEKKEKRNRSPVALLPGMEDYADDSDEESSDKGDDSDSDSDGDSDDGNSDDDNSGDNSENESVEGPRGAPSYEGEGPMRPPTDDDYSSYYPSLPDPSEYLQRLQQQQEEEEHVHLQQVQQHVEAAAHTAPKVIKADAALTSFVPNVLKKKAASGSFEPRPPPTAPPTVPSAHITTTTKAPVVATAAPAAPAPAPAPTAAAATSVAVDIDEDYNRFMQEIEGLDA